MGRPSVPILLAALLLAACLCSCRGDADGALIFEKAPESLEDISLPLNDAEIQFLRRLGADLENAGIDVW